jgi:hypothetical protein
MTFQCKQCEHIASSYYYLKKHILSEHLTENQYTCEKCNKSLSSKQKLDNHLRHCNGVLSLQCPYCKKEFKHRNSKCRHLKKCSQKVQTNNIASQTDIVNNVTINNNCNNTTNNITNNITNTQNITIKFEVANNKECEFISSHITAEDIKNIIDNYYDLGNKYLHLDILNMYNNKLFDIPQNRCIKKTNSRSKYSKIHMGDNKWNFVIDRNVYDKLVMDTSKNFIHKLDETENSIKSKSEFLKKLYFLRGKTDPFTGRIYEDEKELTEELNIAKNNIKCAVLNYSKE